LLALKKSCCQSAVNFELDGGSGTSGAGTAKGVMQTDVTDGVEHLIHRGIVDSDRVAIFGGSYGGYAALAGLTYTPDLYAAGMHFVTLRYNMWVFNGVLPQVKTQPLAPRGVRCIPRIYK